MGLARRVAIGGFWAACCVLSARVTAQVPATPASPRATLRPGASGVLADGSSPYAAPADTAEGVLKDMANRAAVIFIGTVTAIKQDTSSDPNARLSSIVEIDFAVDHAVQGASEGSIYVLREWAGLWRDSPRFVVGQRFLMLLHAANAGGLSSPVDGLDGAIPIKATSSLADSLFAAFEANAVSDHSQQDQVDMRWLQAKTLKTSMSVDAPVSSPGETFAGGLSTTPSLSTAPTLSPSTAVVPAAGPPAATLTHVLGLLKSWQGSTNVSN